MTLRTRLHNGTSALVALWLILCVTINVYAQNTKLPPVASISVEPASLQLMDSRDAQTIIVTGKTADGLGVDLSPKAKITSSSPIVRIDSEGYIHPLKSGKAEILVTAAGRTARVPVEVKGAANLPVSYIRDVLPVMNKVGCSAGTCHGAAKGKNGFKLSLRGYDPDFDYHALVDEIGGRRFNRAAPAQSLMLLKPTGEVPHRGGVLFKTDSRYYAILKKWISEGVKNDFATTKRVASLEVYPSVPNVSLPGMKQKMIVIARYPDGSRRDVTRDAVMTSSLPEVAKVTPTGEIVGMRRGEAAFLIRYEGAYATREITVLGNRAEWRWAAQPQLNYVDRLVDAKLKKIKSLPSPIADDATFLRRVYIDLTGLPPTPETIRAFLADKSPTRAKREAIIDKLLATPEYVDRWTSKWADLLNSNSKFLGANGVRKFSEWIYSSINTNKPYDKFVRELITASGDTHTNPAANYLRVIRDSSVATENMTQLFLGVRFSCAKCHDHPFERWTQDQYYQLGAYFARVGYKQGRDGSEIVFTRDNGEVMNPRTGLEVAPIPPVGRAPKTAELADRRDAFAVWLTSAENPYFSRAIVNRYWSYFFGKGIIDPVDDIRAGNPASNPALLEAMNAEFVKNRFDLKKLIRTIVTSRTYQASITANRWNSDDSVNFSHALPRRMEAEQLLDAINLATGTRTYFAGVNGVQRALQLPDAAANGAAGFLELFGRPARESPCECERSSTISLGQALHLINGPATEKISSPDGRIAKLIAKNPGERVVIEEIFLATLCRMPTEKEMTTSLANFKQAGNLKEGAEDLMWALLNSPAFLFNR